MSYETELAKLKRATARASKTGRAAAHTRSCIVPGCDASPAPMTRFGPAAVRRPPAGGLPRAVPRLHRLPSRRLHLTTAQTLVYLLSRERRAHHQTPPATSRERHHPCWRYAVEQLVAAGAPPLVGDPKVWLEAALTTTTRTVQHPGNHKYAWALQGKASKVLPPSLPYPRRAA